MKKLLPIFLTIIMITCSFSACEKKENQSPLDIYDNVNAYTTFEELKALHNGIVKSEDDKFCTIENCTNTVLQDIAKKYKEDKNVRLMFMNAESSGVWITTTLSTEKIQKLDYDTLISDLSKKYPDYIIEKENENTYIYLDNDNERLYPLISVLFKENTYISIEYMFHPKDYYDN